MCGRYAASAELSELIEEFDVVLDRTTDTGPSILSNPQSPPAGTPDWNMAPTKQAPVVLTRLVEQVPTRQVRLLTWGLVPSWSKDVKGAYRMINARAESVAEKPAYARALASRRALVPAQGWYEWQASPTVSDAHGRPRKQPFFIHRGDGDLVAMAGIYEFWRDASVPDTHDPSAWLVTFAVVTTSADPGLDRIHDRQPLVLERQDWQRWLDPEASRREDVEDLLHLHIPGRFVAHPVSRAVGSNRSNGPHLLDPAPEDDLLGVVDPSTGELIGG